MKRFRNLKQIITFMILLIFSTSFVTPMAIGASSDASESVSVDLSMDHKRKAVVLVPSTDMPSVTLSSTRPVNISHRNIRNGAIKSFSVPDLTEATNVFPINYPFSYSPFTTDGTVDYSKTSWLLFDSVSSESYGDFQVSTNHTALAIDDNTEELFEVDPDFNFYLQIAVGSAGPLSLRLNVFPDPGIGSRYEKVIILDPNGAPVQYFQYVEGDDEYFLLIAEKKGKYVFLIEPTDEKLFFNIETSTFKPEVLDIDDEIHLQIVGTPDSQLTQREIDDAMLTFNWYKYTPEAGDIFFQHFENIRGGTTTAHFVPRENNTVYRGSFGLNVAQFSKRPEYMLIIHDGTARYLFGIEKFSPEPLYPDVLHPGRLRANDFSIFKFNVSTPTSVQVQITSESKGVQLQDIFGTPSQPYVTSTFDILNTNTQVTNLFLYQSSAYLLLENTLPEEAWFEITVSKNNDLVSQEFKDAGDMTPPYNIWSPNAYLDSDLLTFDARNDLPGATVSHVFEYSTLFYQKQLFWHGILGVAFNASNDLVAQHSGETIYHDISINVFGVVNGEAVLLQHDQFSKIYSDSNDYTQNRFSISLPKTFASTEGRYFVTVDSYLDNGTQTLPFESFCYFDIYTADMEYMSYIEDIWFVDDVNSTNLLINTTLSREWMIKVPVEWMNWTDVELHFTNFTLNAKPVIIQDIKGIHSNSYEFSYLTTDRYDMPSDYTEIGNVTTGFGAATDADFVYLYLWVTPLYSGELSSLNITLTRIPTEILVLTKEPDLGGSGAPGFEWIWGISGIAIIVLLLKKKRL